MSIGVRVTLAAVVALCVAGAAVAEIVINEVYYDSPGTDEGTFTELKGDPGMSLDGYLLVGVNGNGGVDYATIDLSGHSIPDDGYFVVAEDSLVADADMIDPLVDWQNGADEVELRLDTEIIDSVCYGFSEDLDCEGGTYAVDASGMSISRCPDGQDTNDNAADWAESLSLTPGASNDCGGAQEPTDYTCAELQEEDADGFPIHYAEYIRITDCVVLVATDVFAIGYLDIHVSDGTGCIQLFDFNYDTGLYPLAEGDLITVVGDVDFYNGMTEITDVEIELTGTAPVPDPSEITTFELATNGEMYESCLIEICGLSIIGGDWPAEGDNANLDIDDGSGPAIMRLDKDTDIDGSPVVIEPFTATGITTQFDDAAPYDEGYQIKPRRRAEILDEVDCPTAVRESSWGQIKGQYR